MAPKSPVIVIIVSVVISGLCTGHPVSRSCLYSFPQNMLVLVKRGLHKKDKGAKSLPVWSHQALILGEKGPIFRGK
jgi:hypothetical protein